MADEQETKTPPTPITMDDVRGVVAGMLKTTEKKLTDTFGGALKSAFEEHLTPIREQLTKTKETPAVKPADPPVKEVGQVTPPEDPRFAELIAKQAKLETELKESKKAAAAEKKNALEAGAYSGLQAALGSKVKAEAVTLVAEILKGRRHLVHDEDGTPKLRFKIEDEDRDLSLDDGIAHFLKSKEASLFLPPPTGGAGPNKRPPPGATPGATPVQGSGPVAAFEAQHGPIENHL